MIIVFVRPSRSPRMPKRNPPAAQPIRKMEVTFPPTRLTSFSKPTPSSVVSFFRRSSCLRFTYSACG